MTAESELTERQREVLALVREGKNPTEIGKALGISSQGVHGHLRRLRGHGLIPDEYAGGTGGKPAATRRPGVRGGTNATITPETAIRAAIELIEAQMHGLQARLTDIAEERTGLDREEEEILVGLERLEAMRSAQAAQMKPPEHKPAAKAKPKPPAKPQADAVTT